MDPLWSQSAFLLSAMPVAVNVYVIAQQYNVYFKTVSSVIIMYGDIDRHNFLLAHLVWGSLSAEG
jgi:predicted permease